MVLTVIQRIHKIRPRSWPNPEFNVRQLYHQPQGFGYRTKYGSPSPGQYPDKALSCKSTWLGISPKKVIYAFLPCDAVSSRKFKHDN